MIYEKRGIKILDTGTQAQAQSNPMHLINVVSDETEYEVKMRTDYVAEER